MSNDPVGFKADDLTTFNRYSYVGNNPYAYTDPDGKARKGKRKEGLAVANLVARGVAAATEPGSALNNYANTVVEATDTAISGKTRSSQMTQAKKDAKIPRSQRAESVSKVKMTDSNGNTAKNPDGSVVKTTEYAHTTTDGNKVIIQDHSAGHQDFGGMQRNLISM